MNDLVDSLDAAPDEAKVFLSYSRKDRECAQGIADALRSRHFGVFRDTDDILPTEEWKTRLEELIAEADTIVFLLSPHSAASEVCAWEVERAASLNKRIAPIVIDDVDAADIPPLLARLNFIFCTPRDPFENAVDTLASALGADIDWIREHTRLAGLAARWQKSGRAARFTLRGQDIVDAETWRDQRPKDAPEVTALQANFLSESRRAAGRRQRKWVIGSLAAAAGAVALAAFAWLQSVEADTQRRAAEVQLETAQINESRFLALRSVEHAEAGDNTAAIQLALMALPQDAAPRPVTAAAEAALRQGLSDFREVSYLPPPSDHLRAQTILSPNGKYAASFDGRGRLTITDLAKMTTLVDVEINAVVANLEFTANDRFLQIGRKLGLGFDAASYVDVWDIEAGMQILERPNTGGHSLSPDGLYLAMIAGEDENKRIDILDTENNKIITQIAAEARVLSKPVFSPDGATLLFTARMGPYDLAAPYLADMQTFDVRPLPITGDPLRYWASWANDGAGTLFTRNSTERERIVYEFWRPPFQKPFHTIPALGEDQQQQLALSKDLRLIAYPTTGEEQTIIADTKSGAAAYMINGYRVVRFFPGSDAFAASSGGTGEIEIHSTKRREQTGRLSVAGRSISDFAINRDGARIVGLTDHGAIHTWAAPIAFSAPENMANRFGGHVQDLQFSNDGERLLARNRHLQELVTADVSATPDGGRGVYVGGPHGLKSDRLSRSASPADVCMLDAYLDSAIWLNQQRRPAAFYRGNRCSGVAEIAPSGDIIAVLDSANLYLQSTSNAFAPASIRLKPQFLGRLVFSPDGQTLLATPGAQLGNGGMALVDLTTRAEIPLEGSAETVATGKAIFTADGARILALTKTDLNIWSARTGRIVGAVPSVGLRVDPNLGLQISALYAFDDGERLLVIGAGGGWIIDIETGETLVENVAGPYIGAFAVSPDGALIATGSYGQPELRVWSMHDAKLRARLGGFLSSDDYGRKGITAVAFSPDGKRIAAGTVDGRVRVWSYPRDFDSLIGQANDLLLREASLAELNIFGD